MRISLNRQNLTWPPRFCIWTSGHTITEQPRSQNNKWWLELPPDSVWPSPIYFTVSPRKPDVLRKLNPRRIEDLTRSTLGQVHIHHWTTSVFSLHPKLHSSLKLKTAPPIIFWYPFLIKSWWEQHKMCEAGTHSYVIAGAAKKNGKQRNDHHSSAKVPSDLNQLQFQLWRC